MKTKLRIVSENVPCTMSLRDLYEHEEAILRDLALVRSRISVLRTAYMVEHRVYGLSDHKLRRIIKA